MEYRAGRQFETRIGLIIGSVGKIRRCTAGSLHFHASVSDQLIYYSKSTPHGSNVILVVINLSPSHTHSGWFYADLDPLWLDSQHPFQVQDLLTNTSYQWNGPRNYVELNPHSSPAHIFCVRRRLRTEQGVEQYM